MLHNVPPNSSLGLANPTRRKNQLQKSKFAPKLQTSDQRIHTLSSAERASKTTEQVTYELELRNQMNKFRVAQSGLGANPQQADSSIES